MRAAASLFVPCLPRLQARSIARLLVFFFQAEDGIRYYKVTGVQTCALPILANAELVGVAELRDRQQRRRIHLEHGEVGLRIATHELRGELPPVREAHGDVLRDRKSVV